MFVTVKEALEKTMCLNSVGNILKRCDTENREWWWRQIKQIYIYIYMVPRGGG